MSKLSEEVKEEIRKGLSKHPDLSEKLCDLSEEEFIEFSKALELRNLLGHQSLSNEENHALKRMVSMYSDDGISWVAIDAFLYGRIEGIRAERARRKVRA